MLIVRVFVKDLEMSRLMSEHVHCIFQIIITKRKCWYLQMKTMSPINRKFEEWQHDSSLALCYWKLTPTCQSYVCFIDLWHVPM